MKRISNYLGALIFFCFFFGLHGVFNSAIAQYITVQNGNFSRAGQAWFPYGLNYWPYYAFEYPPSYPEFWLGDGYRHEVIEADLTTLASLGVNCISTQASLLVEQAPAHLTDFLNRCRNHNITVILAFPKANPMNPLPQDGPTYGRIATPYIDPETSLDQIIPSLHLEQRPEILSYDIAWEPHLGLCSEGRAAWDGVWSRFIAREFSSIAEADNIFSEGGASPSHKIARTRAALASGLVSVSMPVRTRPGRPVDCTIVMQNLGDAPAYTWNQGTVVLLPLFGVGLPASSTPIKLKEASVTPGNPGTFTFTYNATSPGRKRLRLIMAALVSGVYQPFGTIVEWEVEVVSSGSVVVRTLAAPTPILGPADTELYDPVTQKLADEPPLPTQPPPACKDYLVNAFRRCLDTETATRFGRITRRIRQMDPNHLISCRQGWDGNGNPNAVQNYPLELVATAYHFDFQGLENYYLNKTEDPLSQSGSDYILAGMATDQAYSRWATGGKPVIWAESGYLYAAPYDDPPVPPQPQQQADYYSQFITLMLQTNGSGAQFWWWPGGLRTTESGQMHDFGFTDPDGTLRPAAMTMSNLAAQATSPRNLPSETVTGTPVDLLADNRGYAWIYYTHQSEALTAVRAGKGYALNGQGAGTDSTNANYLGGLPQYLWAEITKVELKVGENGTWFEVRDGMAYAVPAGKKIFCRAEVINMGDATWLTNVAFAANTKQANFLTFTPQSLATTAPRLTKVVIPEFQLTKGLTADHPVQFQMNAQGVSWITGSVHIHLAVSKPVLTGVNFLMLDE